MVLIHHSAASGAASSRLADQRVREWTLHLDAERRQQQKTATAPLPGSVQPYVTLSREAGTGGAEIALRVAEQLGWECLHREMLDEIARRFNLPRAMVGLADESTSNWLVEMFGKWLDPRLVTHSEYIVHLGQVVLLAARHSSKVFVGRGAQFFLPADRGVSVYIVAPLPMRIKRIREVRQCSEAEAKKYIAESDRSRHDLIKSYFNHQIGDPHLYDLIINRAHVSVEMAAAMIVGHCRQRFGIQ
jgi:cytidylate kinase